MKRPLPLRICTVVLLVLLAMAGNGFANSIEQYNPSYDVPGGTVQLYTDLTNDDSGAIYDSYETTVFSNLITTLWSNPANQSAYSNQTEMLDDWSVSISQEGDIEQNWEHNSNYSNLELSHYGLGYDHWTTAGDSDLMRLILTIPLSQLDGDGDGWAIDDPMDYQVTFGNSVSNCGVGINGGFSWSASAEPYEASLNPQTTSNGTSILWLESYGITNDYETASTNNPDLDSYPTGQEYTLDTNPTNTTPDFRLTFPGGSNPAVMTFSPSSTGRTYTVFKTVGLTNPVWIAGATCTGTVNSTTITNVLVLGPQYIQIRVNRPE